MMVEISASRNCPYCAEGIGANVLSCPHCRSSLRETGRPKRILKGYRPAPPWERRTILGIIGLSLLSHLYFYLIGEGSAFGTAITLIMFAGVYTRSTWGWWLTNGLCGLNLLLLLGVGSLVSGGEGVSLYVGAAVNAAIVVLLLLSRLRGSYE